MNRKYLKILIVLISTLTLFSSCKKDDIFGPGLPSGRLSGVLKFESTNQPAKDIYIIVTDTIRKSMYLTYSKVDGSFAVSHLATGKYKIVPTNDSLYCPTEIIVDVTDPNNTIVPDILIKPTQIPVVTIDPVTSVIALTKTSIKLQAFVNHGYSTVVSRGFKYLKTSDTRDVTLSGTTKNITTSTDPWTLNDYTTTITSGLTANTEYKIVAYVSYYRGKTSTGARKLNYAYSNTIIVKTPAI
ncbi:MAG: hypothetical protein A2X17_07250 [Bacteroidetes bacterium GWF2_41_61]|nr:MAG: hypothetical protein A2X20_10295 [Bacteroidetes bacterium GWE2_40_15]OFY30653.1 MAG: hypothetical protein A2X17_07250 [Bacteroidetes bacterium GWF2_41_61]OFY89376.1 MAG: hypothetical protein A2266_06565 [Bacteroidetes bacterium RIFOXYA12_FULL_40_10]HBZ25027.1 hypothetical protein [Rikenellaceae bacterium]